MPWRREEHLNLIYRAANTLIARFVEMGILQEMTRQQRNRRFAYAARLGMFTDEVLSPPAPGAQPADAAQTGD